jgi:hypothetical protein
VNQALENTVPFFRLPVRLLRLRVTEGLLDALVPQVRLYKLALELATIVHPQAANALLTVVQQLLECRVNARRVFIRHGHSPALLRKEVDGGKNSFDALLSLVGKQGCKVRGDLLEWHASFGASAFNGVCE